MAKKGATQRDRRSSSRHSTPLSTLGSPAPPTPQQATPTSVQPAPSVPKETAYIHTMTSALVSADPSIEALIERSNGASTKGEPPSAKELQSLHDKIKDTVANFMGKRSTVCDRSMRQLAQKRSANFRAQQEREMEQARVKREEEDSERKKGRKLGKKRSRDEMEVDEEGSEGREEKKEVLPSIGAHGVARQDGVGVHEGEFGGVHVRPVIRPARSAVIAFSACCIISACIDLLNACLLEILRQKLTAEYLQANNHLRHRRLPPERSTPWTQQLHLPNRKPLVQSLRPSHPYTSAHLARIRHRWTTLRSTTSERCEMI